MALLKIQKNKTPQITFIKGEGALVYSHVLYSCSETSVLTFISIPGIAYRGDWTFLQLSVGYIIGRAIVCVVLLPSYFKIILFLYMKLLE